MRASFVALCLFFHSCHAWGQDARKMQDIANNFSHENLICSAYYLFVAQCLENKLRTDPVIKQYRDGAGAFLHRGIETGKLAGLSDKAISAKMDIAIESMKAETENNCVNISVLLKAYAQSCKSDDEGRTSQAP
jgi:hypothetical protein